MDLTAVTTTAIDVLPTEPTGRRWRLGRGHAADSAPAPHTEHETVADPQAEEPSDPAPLASFGRWLADLEDAAPAEPPAQADATDTVSGDEDAPDEPEVAPADEDLVKALRREIKQLSDELDTVRQRSAAERMRLLEELSAAREARHAAQTELASIQSVLEAAEAQIPRQRTQSFTLSGFEG